MRGFVNKVHVTTARYIVGISSGISTSYVQEEGEARKKFQGGAFLTLLGRKVMIAGRYLRPPRKSIEPMTFPQFPTRYLTSK